MRGRLLVGLAVFALVYALLAVPRLGRALRERAAARWGRAGEVALSRPGIVVAGALLVVALLQVAPLDAWRAIDLRTLALLLGMMLLVAALDAANAFEVLAARLAAALPTPRRLLVGSMLVVAVLSALVLNDAVVLLFTPVLVRAARAMATSPIPFLVGEAIAANIGSVATPTGNPQNAAIALARDLSYLDFVTALGPLALVCLAMGVAACLVAFRGELPRTTGAVVQPAVPAPRITSAPMLLVAAVALGIALGGFLFGPLIGIPLWASALGAGILALVAAPLARVGPMRVARRVDVGILAFFAGLFVLIEVVRTSGALDLLADAMARGGSGAFVVATAVLSNVVSNVPAVLLLLPTVTSDAQALLLAASSTLAGNATFLGSAATVIVAEAARREGAAAQRGADGSADPLSADFSVLRFTLVGLPLAVATLALAWWALG